VNDPGGRAGQVPGRAWGCIVVMIVLNLPFPLLIFLKKYGELDWGPTWVGYWAAHVLPPAFWVGTFTRA